MALILTSGRRRCDDGNRNQTHSQRTHPAPLARRQVCPLVEHDRERPGSVKGSPYDRVKNETAAAINCLFGDFDAKDEVLPDEYAPFLPGDFGTLKLVDREKAIKAAQV